MEKALLNPNDFARALLLLKHYTIIKSKKQTFILSLKSTKVNTFKLSITIDEPYQINKQKIR